MHSGLTVIHCVIKDMFINDDNLCANMDIDTNSFKLSLMDMTTDKLYWILQKTVPVQNIYTVQLQILQKTVPVQNIYTVQLQIFQNTENCSVQKLILCNYRYSKTLKTVPVQKH